jgi:protein-S-isoprenylcysteine O-methyltransferase Ste14
MAEPLDSKNTPPKGAVVGLRLGSTTIRLTGFWASLVVAVFFALVVFGIYLLSVTSDSLLWVSAVLWVLFIGYWSAVAGRSAATRDQESTASRQLHQILMYGALALTFVRVPGLGRRWLPGAWWVVLIGFTVQIGSALLAVWARRHLGRNWSGAISAKVDHQLVRSGPYRSLRHPIYTAMLGMFLGTALVSGELHALLGLIIITTAYWRKIRLEERYLTNVFGVEYDEYRGKSWALIPGIL